MRAVHQTESGDVSVVDDSLIIRVDAATYRIGNVLLDSEMRSIEMPGWINQDKGLVEYFAVAPGGKTHESVLVLDIQPLHLETALMLLGLDFGQNLAFQGDSTAPRGDEVTIEVSFVTPDGDSVRIPATDLLYDYQHDTPVPATNWVFTGSMLWEGRLLADVEGSIIATFADPAAILNNPNSGRTDDTMYGVHEDRTPPPQTPVTMTITATKK